MSTDPAQNVFIKAFSDPAAVARHTDGPRRFVPGFDALHTMTGILLAERAGPDAHVLVLGAGGGLELKALAEAHPGWRFTGVDPAGAMLDLARETTAAHASRIALVEGLIDDAPAGPFDAATCLLTLHFLDAEERRRTAAAIHARLKPGAPFVAAHASFSQEPRERDRHLNRYAAYATASGADLADTAKAKEAVGASLRLFEPEEDARILEAAGFRDVAQFYAAFTWRGWVGYA